MKRLFYFFLFIPLFTFCQTKSTKHNSAYLEYQNDRNQMVDTQIISRGVNNKRVINAIRKIPRHVFIPVNNQSKAYADHPVKIGRSQTISQPYIVAYMTQAIDPKPTHRVLEIGTGSGYQAAILAELVDTVYTIEIIPELGKRAKAICKELGYNNIQYRIGDGYHGWLEKSPFDAIIVTAAPGHVPQILVEQLAIGGIMIIPVGKSYQELIVIKKDASGITQKSVMGVRFVPMTGEAEK